MGRTCCGDERDRLAKKERKLERVVEEETETLTERQYDVTKPTNRRNETGVTFMYTLTFVFPSSRVLLPCANISITIGPTFHPHSLNKR